MCDRILPVAEKKVGVYMNTTRISQKKEKYPNRRYLFVHMFSRAILPEH